MSLNPSSSNPYYVLGRLFSVLETIQRAANPGIKATIKDRYFNSASATPATVFPVLINLAQKHLKKLSDEQKVFYERLLKELLEKLGEEFPVCMNLAQQGSFQLGYYQQNPSECEKEDAKGKK